MSPSSVQDGRYKSSAVLGGGTPPGQPMPQQPMGLVGPEAMPTGRPPIQTIVPSQRMPAPGTQPLQPPQSDANRPQYQGAPGAGQRAAMSGPQKPALPMTETKKPGS